MLATTELTTAGWIFMLASTVSMTVLTIWCFVRVLRQPPDHDMPAGLGP